MKENRGKGAHPVRKKYILLVPSLFSTDKQECTHDSAGGKKREITNIVMPLFVLRIFKAFFSTRDLLV